MIRLPASKARERFSEILNKVAYGHDRLVLQRHGKDVAAVISAEDLKRFEELEDLEDLADLADLQLMDNVLAKGETPIPWKQAKTEIGVK